MVSLKIRLDILTMEKLLELADKQACSASTVLIIEFKKKIFQQFLLKNPVWDFHGITRDDYLAKSKAEREQPILTYHISMINGEQLHFIDFFEGVFYFF